jgi:Ca2+-transporting ATPase
VTYLLISTGAGEVLAVAGALALGMAVPFTAAQLLWLNLVTNGIQDVALAFEPGEPGLLQRPPRPRGQGILERRLLERLGGVGMVLAVGTLGVFWWTWTATGDLVQARTIAMTQMVVFQFFHVINCRSLDRSILRVPIFANRFLFVSFVLAAFAQLAALHWSFMQGILRTVPLSGTQWLVVIAVGSTVVLGGELDKWRNRRSRHLLG